MSTPHDGHHHLPDPAHDRPPLTDAGDHVEEVREDATGTTGEDEAQIEQSDLDSLDSAGTNGGEGSQDEGLTDEELSRLIDRRAMKMGVFTVVVLFIACVFLAIGRLLIAYDDYPVALENSTLYGSKSSLIYIAIAFVGIVLGFIPSVLYLKAHHFGESSVAAVIMLVASASLGMLTYPMSSVIHSNTEILSCIRSVDPEIADEMTSTERALIELPRPGEESVLISRSPEGVLSLGTITGQRWSCSD